MLFVLGSGAEPPAAFAHVRVLGWSIAGPDVTEMIILAGLGATTAAPVNPGAIIAVGPAGFQVPLQVLSAVARNVRAPGAVVPLRVRRHRIR